MNNCDVSPNNDEVLKSPEIVDLVKGKLEALRRRLLDFTRRNPLVSIKFSPTSTSFLRVVDELPDVLRHHLVSGKEMRLVPLPALEEELPDEQSDEFRGALFIAQQEDEFYLAAIEQINSDDAKSEEKILQVERELKDRIRADLLLPPRQTKDNLSLVEHAKLHDVSPSYILPLPDDVHADGRHEDDDVQTLLLPDRLTRTAKAVLEKGRAFERETGVNVLHIAFGLLEWKDPQERERFVSPLLLLEIRIERKQSPQGAEFFIRSEGEVLVNSSLAQKLQTEHGLSLPEYEGGNIESYFEAIHEAQPPGWNWKVRREVALGIFPSSKIAMYHDLDPEKRPVAEKAIVGKLLATTGTGDGSYAPIYETDNPQIAKQVPYLVADADASQYSALVDVAGGSNVALEGPPGSGKSQTIVNLISAALADGKKVLFVAEKLTALDVVKSRLDAAGLGGFILPLQAGKGTTESVYESIEFRLEMGSGSGASRQQFQMRQNALDKDRAILQGYLDALGSNLGATGLTVHKVIGHAIATAATRAALPREIRRLSIQNTSNMGQNDVEALLSEVRAFGDRLERNINMPVLWRASHAPITTHDLAEDIAATAGELADTLDVYQHDITNSEISVFLTANPFLVDMEAIGKLLVALARDQERIDLDLIETLTDPSIGRLARQLCSQVRERQTLLAVLGQFLRDPEGEDTDARLKSAAEFAATTGNRLDPAQHERRIAELAGRIISVEKAIKSAKALPEIWTNSGKTLAEIQAEARRIAAQPDEILGLRRADPLDSLAEVARDLEARLSSLSGELNLLRQAIPAAGGHHNAAEIRSAAGVVETVGIFGRLGSAFKVARNIYISVLGGQGNDTRSTMASLMRSYASWLDAKREFEESLRYKEYFGALFQGLDTNLEKISRLVHFHSLCKEISKTNTNLHSYLQSGDLSPALAFAEDEDAPKASLADLESLLNSLTHEADREKRLSIKAFEHLDDFREKECLLLTDIKEIRIKKAAEVDLKKIIDECPARGALGKRYAGSSTDSDLLSVECDLAEAIVDSSDAELAMRVIRAGRIGAMAKEFEDFAARRARLYKQAATFVSDLGLPESLDSAPKLSTRLNDLQDAARDPQSLLDRAQLLRAEESLRMQGLGDLIDWAIDQGKDFDSARLAPIVRALIARSMADAAHQKHGNALQGYDGQDFDRIRHEIQEKDRELIAMSRRVIANELLTSARPPAGNNIGRKSTFTDMSLIYNELHKKKRRIGIRDLTRRAGSALLELKPCWMMSPLAVAQYLHEGMEFDLVVIDEASQMTPENALGALSRAGQAVIVGDTKQLPPTSFFSKMLDDSDVDEDLREDSESILDMANVAFMPVRQLRWHYRSKHSALIQFSNQWMYKGELTIFPSAQEDHPDLGVELVEVQGIYKGKRNEIEARAIVKAALHHMTHRPELSLGICTMNSDQKDLILEEFERERDRSRNVRAFIEKWEVESDGLEEFFIKNIETIQGDERDVMFISTLYGPETPGAKVFQRFGPVNSTQGHRRLNVLFTRAKRQIKTFTSMKPTDILVDESKNLGVRMFRGWLEYCKTGHIPDMAGPQGETESPFEDYVASQIELLGCEVVPQVGVAGFRIDLGVRHPDWPYGYILGVECDGATYHSSKSSRDRDRLREDVLKGLGWRLHRIWSTDWFRNPRQEIEVLKDAIDAALAKAKADGNTHSERLDARSLVTHLADSHSADASQQKDAKDKIEQHNTSRSAETSVSDQKSFAFDVAAGELLDSEAKIAFQPIIAVGSHVKVETITDGRKKLAFVLVEGGNAPEDGKIGIHTPLGEALLDAQVGDEIEYQVGSHIKEVRVLEIR